MSNQSDQELAAAGTVDPSDYHFIDQPDALVYAAELPHYYLVEYLLRSGADINVTDDAGTTALMAASSVVGCVQIVELLLARGANPNLIDKDGDTALDLARYYKNSEIIELLLKHNALENNQPAAKKGIDDAIYEDFETANRYKHTRWDTSVEVEKYS